MRRLSLGVLAAALLASGSARAAGAFDGAWTVTITCTQAHDGASGYVLRFGATVQDSRLHGANGIQGQAGSLSLDGTIAPDGSALLQATGLTSSPVYNVGHLPPNMPVNYHLKAMFQGRSGTGTRIELRPCEAAFAKQ